MSPDTQAKRRMHSTGRHRSSGIKFHQAVQATATLQRRSKCNKADITISMTTLAKHIIWNRRRNE